MKKVSLIIIVGLLLASCGVAKQVSVRQYRQPYSGEVTVLAEGQKIPEGAIFLGTVYLGDSGTTLVSCGYEKMLNGCINQAKKMGGNYLSIVEHGLPNFWSHCHRLKTNVYFVEPSDK